MKLHRLIGTSATIVSLLAVTTGLNITKVKAQTANCANPVTTSDMEICSAQAAQTADRQLNQVYALLSSKLKGQQRQRLMAAELAWIKFRDATCAYEAGQFEGGTFAPVAKNSCFARVTRQRIQELKNYLQDINRS